MRKPVPVIACGFCGAEKRSARPGYTPKFCSKKCRDRSQWKGGMGKTPEYGAWQHAKTRCFNENTRSYRWYGARGIDMAPEWVDSFEAFFAHIGRRPTPRHQLDRIDNNRGYWPGNVRWVTPVVQERNRRDNHMITIGGETRCIAEWAQLSGLPVTTLRNRVAHGNPIETLLLPPHKGTTANAIAESMKASA